ncbi:MAG: hypothetical protein ACK58T_13625, partial [Phycisphaerae bacterium]
MLQRISMMEGYSEVSQWSLAPACSQPVCVRSPENTVSACDTDVYLRNWQEPVLLDDSNVASGICFGDLKHSTQASAMQNCLDRKKQTSALPNLDSGVTDSPTSPTSPTSP